MKRSTRMPCTPKSDSAPTPFSRSPLEPNDKLQRGFRWDIENCYGGALDSTLIMPAPAFVKNLNATPKISTCLDQKCAEEQQESLAASECLLRPSLWPQSLTNQPVDGIEKMLSTLGSLRPLPVAFNFSSEFSGSLHKTELA